jgi:hypothetical protein
LAAFVQPKPQNPHSTDQAQAKQQITTNNNRARSKAVPVTGTAIPPSRYRQQGYKYTHTAQEQQQEYQYRTTTSDPSELTQQPIGTTNRQSISQNQKPTTETAKVKHALRNPFHSNNQLNSDKHLQATN